MTIEVFLDYPSAVDLFIASKIPETPRSDEIYKIGLFSDTFMMQSLNPKLADDYIKDEPYATVELIDLLPEMREIPRPTVENVADLHRALNEPVDLDGGLPSYLSLRASILKSSKGNYFFYVTPNLWENYIGFCHKYQPDYLERMKQSFLCFDILDLIFKEQLSSFTPKLPLELISQFSHFKEDFQEGILELAQDLSGSYRLSSEQEDYIRKVLTSKETELLEFLKPEKLSGYDIDLASIGFDIVSMAIPIPIPLGFILEIGRKIKRRRDFKKKNLNFILSIYILKRLFNIQGPPTPPKCSICSLSSDEIENLSEEEGHKIALEHEFCQDHIIAYLTLRKTLQLFGKDLLAAMKMGITP